MRLLEVLEKIIFFWRDSFTIVTQTDFISKQFSYLQKRGFTLGKSEISLNFLFVNEKNIRPSDNFLKELKQIDYIDSIEIIEEKNEIYISGKTSKMIFNEYILKTLYQEVNSLVEKYGFTFLGWGTDIK